MTPDSTDVNDRLEALTREVADMKRRTTRRNWLLAALVSLVAAYGIAQPVITPFQPDTAALASEINSNFTQVAQWSVPRGAVIFFDGALCPTGWSVVPSAQGRLIMGRPGAGTLGQAFGSALTGNNEAAHSHSENGAGAHSHTGGLGAHAGYYQAEINYTTVPGYISPYHLQNSLNINPVGDHTHAINAVNGSSVLPYVYFTPCRKD